MSVRCNIVICAALMLVTGCKAAPEPISSLVGATKLPSPADLEKEVIVLARVGGNDGEDLLNIEIHPTGDLLVSHTRNRAERPIAEERLHLSPLQLQRLRTKLWRLRPDNGAPADKSVPVGCRWVYDVGEDWQLGFVREDRPEDLVIFALPYPQYCRSRAYVEARQLIAEVTRDLPASKVIQRFPPGRFQALGAYFP